MIYILGDNGASAEGFHGTIDELLTENSLPNTAKHQIEAHLFVSERWGYVFFLRGNLQAKNQCTVPSEWGVHTLQKVADASMKNDLR